MRRDSMLRDVMSASWNTFRQTPDDDSDAHSLLEISLVFSWIIRIIVKAELQSWRSAAPQQPLFKRPVESNVGRFGYSGSIVMKSGETSTNLMYVYQTYI